MILIFPFAKKLNYGPNKNPKNYPWWKELIALINSEISINGPIIQVGVEGEEQLVKDFYKNLPLSKLGELVDICDTWIGVDSFGQHFCWDRGKYGIVLWGQSDPLIFGHSENINLLKDRKYLREKQFWWWEQCDYREDCWVEPEIVLEKLKLISYK